MVKKLAQYIVICIVLLMPTTLCAQNLVPNPGFEVRNQCPSNIGSINYSPGYTSFPTVQGWVSPMPLGNGSPDYFNSCASFASGVHVPEAVFGYQTARTGNAYAGIIAWEGKMQSGGGWSSDVREYLQCKLLQPMQAGQRYCVSFYVNPTISSSHNFNYVSIDAIGVHFSSTQLTQATGYVINVPYHVRNQAGIFLSDTANWIKVSGVYVATGGEEWMTVGSFGPAVPNHQQSYPPTVNMAINHRSYVYLDDFNIVPISQNDTMKQAQNYPTCDPNNVNLDLATTAVDGSNYYWNTGATTEGIHITQPGTYWCIAKTTCNILIDTFHVFYDPNFRLNLGKDTGNCENQPVQIKAPLGGYTSFLWNTGSTSDNITVNKTGYYVLTATNQCGTQVDSIYVSIQDGTPPPTVADTTFCQMVRNPQIVVDGVGLKWYLNATSLAGSTTQPYIYTLEPGKDAIYVTQTIGYCESERVPVTITIKYQPREEMPDQITMCEKYKYILGSNINDDVTYKWSTGESVCCITPSREGTYRRAATNECGTYIDSVMITISECDQCVVVPTAFTPNRDGKNDMFGPIVTCPIGRFHMMVYNRWGNKLYETSDYNQGWDGSNNGNMSDDGTYVYVIEYSSTSTHRTNMLKGTFVLFR